MFDWITATIATRGYAGVAAFTVLENLFIVTANGGPGVRTVVPLPAGFARMPRSIYLTFSFSALGTTLWTVA